MISLKDREHAEKVRSAFDASRTNAELLLPAATFARYRAPSETTVFPLEYAFHLLGDVTGKTILDYGCGDGVNAIVLANYGAKVIACDLSAQLLAVAKKRLEINGCGGVELVLGSGHTLPLPAESVDIVFGMGILHHLDLKMASGEVRRVLRKGGRGIFKEPLRNSKLVARVRPVFPMRSDVSLCERPLTEEEVNDFAAPYARRARTFQLLLSSVARVLPFWSRGAMRLSAHVDTYLLGQFPSLAHFGTIKVFEMIKEG